MYEIGEKLFDKGDYQEAFKIFKQIAQDENQSNIDRSDAYNMMGAVIYYHPDLSEDEDESGLAYYKIALQFNYQNISALLNIVSTFGETAEMHQDVEAFKSVYKTLMNRKSELDAEGLEMLRRKYILMQKIERKNNRGG